MSERTTDQEFTRLFSPKILEKLAEDAFDGAVHIFRSAPGAGKTTLLRAFTPAALRAFWRTRQSPELTDSYQKLVARGILDPTDGPQILGVYLSCASGYADLPPGADIKHEGLFRALLDCRVVLRTLRSVYVALGLTEPEQLNSLRLEYADAALDFKFIPQFSNASDLANWAEDQEKLVYAQLDDFLGGNKDDLPLNVRFESILWLQAVRFLSDGKVTAPKRLLMIDDLHKLRRKQRSLLIEEFTIARSAVPVWLAERTSALGETLLSRGAREGRDLREYNLEDMWSGPKGPHQFSIFAQNILDRRMVMQDMVALNSFSQCIQGELVPGEIRDQVEKGIRAYQKVAQQHQANERYSEWLSHADQHTTEQNLDSLLKLYVTRILLIRDKSKRQMTLEIALSADDFDDRDSSQVRAAAEIFMHEELKIPYYFGLDRLCVMATSNIEELLSLAAALYVGLQAKQVLRKRELILNPLDQEALLKNAAKSKREFIPKSHSEGSRAQRLLDSVGLFCREKTFLPNAPYAPGVTGVRLTQAELATPGNTQKKLAEKSTRLMRVLAECVAENLLVSRHSAASTSRESGTVFYLNRTLCAYYNLPLQMGGWQDVAVSDLITWMDIGLKPSRPLRLDMDY